VEGSNLTAPAATDDRYTAGFDELVESLKKLVAVARVSAGIHPVQVGCLPRVRLTAGSEAGCRGGCTLNNAGRRGPRETLPRRHISIELNGHSPSGHAHGVPGAIENKRTALPAKGGARVAANHADIVPLTDPETAGTLATSGIRVIRI